MKFYNETFKYEIDSLYRLTIINDLIEHTAKVIEKDKKGMPIFQIIDDVELSKMKLKFDDCIVLKEL